MRSWQGRDLNSREVIRWYEDGFLLVPIALEGWPLLDFNGPSVFQCDLNRANSTGKKVGKECVPKCVCCIYLYDWGAAHLKPIAIWCIYKLNAFEKWPGKRCLKIATWRRRRDIKSDWVKRMPLSQNVSSVLGLAGYVKFSGAGVELAVSIECGHLHMPDRRFPGNLGRRTRGRILVYR